MTAEGFLELLPPTRTHKHRSVQWHPESPGKGRLRITDDRSSTLYDLAEFRAGPEWPGRAFRLTKVGEPVSYDVYLDTGTDHRCDCAGKSYEASEKADRREREATGEVGDWQSLGCRHLDAVQALVLNGWV